MDHLTSLGAAVAHSLRDRGETIAVAESAAGGLISAGLLAVPGASAYFLGGSVIYTLASRKQLLRMTRADVEGLAPLTEAMALAFAEKARAQLGATWGLAELGIAGPTGVPYGPAGSCVVGLAGPSPASVLIETGATDREQNMWAFAQGAFELLTQTLAQDA